MKTSLYLSIFFILTIAGADKSIPVMVGGKADLDACGGFGEIQGLNVHNDGFLAVRKGPSTKYDMIDKLYNGDNIWFCDKNAKWSGIVYGEDCEVSSPIEEKMPYQGSCKSGWVFDKWIVLIAG